MEGVVAADGVSAESYAQSPIPPLALPLHFAFFCGSRGSGRLPNGPLNRVFSVVEAKFPNAL